MPIIQLETNIAADIETVFDLARNIDFHQASLPDSQEKAIAGTITGLIGLDQWVTWEAIHFGIKQQLTSKITHFEAPVYFRDSMLSGAFKRFNHDHYFKALDAKNTLMTDVFDYVSPLGLLGKLADHLFLERYMRRLLFSRNQLLKQEAETGR